MSEIILIQHCQSEHHVNNMSGGWTDTPLTELGRKQAEMIGKKLKEVVDKNDFNLYSSDLLRASQTAEIVGSQLGGEVIHDQGLREINTGVAAGKTKDWARANKNPRTKSGFDLDYREFQDGESWREFYTRVCACMDRIYESEKDKNLVIVTHGGTLGYILAWWMKFEPEMIVNAYFSSSVGGITVLSQNSYQQNVVNKFNDTSHFDLFS
ncbi:histidine phosphatase family protein [Sporosarcina thermotolerans]|uniref:Histidine phosphatase family protein n=1 Tax=Sporosarcina thermotolerans TaxID=633404 RepID=A0AAW9A8W4_9BACL|nr:histidine phosphatase family protein [Sporosarcina thermotolerans]MDW0117489.1 histidine phosphatase family protein [Sporosarcina thermotolerans]